MKICEVQHNEPNTLPHLGYLDHALVSARGHRLVSSPSAADYSYWSLNTPPKNKRKRSAMGFIECPLSQNYEDIYSQAESFHTLFLFGRHQGAFPLTLDPIVFPYPPETHKDIHRTDTRLRGRKVFYAGTRVFADMEGTDPRRLGRISLYRARNQTVEDLRTLGVDVHAEGIGWERNSRVGPRWIEDKLAIARSCGADFHLCIENSVFPDYVSEKIHHGFQTDLVVLYLGNDKIHESVPGGAFVNLNPFLDRDTGTVDVGPIAERILSMTQEEYDSIVYAARRWRRGDMLEERRREQMHRITSLWLDRM
jgi:hypothetical protein